MLSNIQMKDIVAQNLGDIRIYAIQAFLARLITRKTYGSGIEQYRIRDKITNTAVVSLDDFITKLNADVLVADYFYYSDGMTGDRTHPIAVNLSNFEVTLDRNSPEDSIYFSMFGAEAKNILILLNYLLDNDDNLPLKIFEIRIIGQK